MLQHPAWSAALAAAAILLCLSLAMLLPASTLEGLIRKGSLFELGSILGWLAAGLTALVIAASSRAWTAYAPPGVVMLLFAAREADWHKAFTADSILKTNYYQETVAPLTEKVLGAVVAVGILFLLAYCALRYSKPVWHGLRRFAAWAVTVVAGLGLLVFSKVVDRSVGMMKDEWGLEVPLWLEKFQAAVEEPLEFVVPAFFILATLQHADRGERRAR